MDVTRKEVALRFRLAKIAIYQPPMGVVNLGRPAMGLRAAVCVFWNSFHDREIGER